MCRRRASERHASVLDAWCSREVQLAIRPAQAEDVVRLDEIRRAAFAPVFASFRAILGDEIYALAQARDDAAQGVRLVAMLAPGSPWELHVAELAGALVGFVSLRLDHEMRVGEIGLNAVDPAHAGKGLGTEMYDFALARMKDGGMKVATVSAGGDPSHAPARRAYEKAGFAVEIPSVWMCRLL
jgi:RimJ/RimL family protein N-acetyltransferase